MGVVSSGFVWRAKTDNRLAQQQGGVITYCRSFLHCMFDCVGIMPIDLAHHMPAVSLNVFCGVIGKSSVHMPVNGYTVIIIRCYEFTQF